MSVFRPPIASTVVNGERVWALNIGSDERKVVSQLLDELRNLLLAGDDPDGVASPLLQRLFPTAYPDDEEKEAEYQRLMREELVASRLHQINAVDETLRDEDAQLDEAQVIALMQSINAVRIVLGTMLDVTDDEPVDEADDDDGADDDVIYEQRLYEFLSWLLDWTVRSLQV